MKYNRVSIIIPCYNDGRYLPEAIESVKQCDKNLYEVIIIDDGSDDQETLEVLDKIEKEGFKVIRIKHQGQSTARNIGAKEAKYDYLLFLDSDNRIFPEYIKEGIKILNKNPEVGVVFGDRKEFGLSNNEVMQSFNISEVIFANTIDTCVVIRKKAWQDCRGFDENLDFWEDWEFFINVWRQGWKFEHIPKIMFEYRIKKDSVNARSQERKKRTEVIKYVYRKHYPLFVDKWGDMTVGIILQKKNKEIIELKAQLSQSQAQLSQSQAQLSQLSLQLQEIKKSLTWKLLRIYQNIIDFILPPGFILRRIYNNIIKTEQRLINKNNKNDAKNDKHLKNNLPTKGKQICVCTIIARNYYPQAELLAKSYKKHHPNHNFYVLFIDDLTVYSEYYKSVPLSDLKFVKNIKSLLFKYNATEFSTAIKPFFLEYLIKKENPSVILFFDPDIYIFKPLDFLINQLNAHDIVLIPHITSEPGDDKLPDEWSFMRAGYYNLGFVGFQVNDKTKKYIKWWQEKTYNYCYADPENYMFTDQKWMDFAPSYLNAYIVHENGYDVAYWNLHQYINQFPPERVNFFHFSGFLPEVKAVSKHQNRYQLKDLKEYRWFFDFYKRQLNNYKQNKDYRYSRFDNNVEIASVVRKIYAQVLKKNLLDPALNPFETKGESSFYNWLITPTKNPTVQLPYLNIFEELYYVQSNIAHFFPKGLNGSKEEQTEYFNWCINFSSKEYGIADIFIKKQKILAGRNFTPKKFYLNNFLAELLFAFKAPNTEQFLNHLCHIYCFIMRREPNEKIIKYYLKNLNYSTDNRFLALYSIIKSSEFRYNFSKPFLYQLLRISIGLLAFLNPLWVWLKRLSLYQTKKSKIKIAPKLGLNLSGYMDTTNGIGDSARGILKALEAGNTPFNVNNIAQPWLRRNRFENHKYFTDNHNLPINLICVNADQVDFVTKNCLPEAKKYLENKYNIGYWYWEGTIFPKKDIGAFRLFNEIWAATDFIYNSLINYSPVPVVKIPPAFVKPLPLIDEKEDIFKKIKLDIKHTDFVFLNVFDSNSYWQRKNPLAVIRAFKKAFGKKSSAKLIIKTIGLRKMSIYSEIKVEIAQNSNIFLIDKYLSYKIMNQLYYKSHAYVSLHRCEGMGIPLIQSMLCAKPVIATNYGGNTDFMSIKNSYLVNFDSYILQDDIGPYSKGTIWAEPDVTQAAYFMNKIYNNYSQASEIAKRGQQEVFEYFNPRRICKLIENRLKFIYNNKLKPKINSP